MTPFTNIHVAPEPEPGATEHSLPRLRSLTNDPAREYAQRPGQVERLPDSVAALILCKTGHSKVGRNGIRVEGIAAKPLNFWCENSVTIATKAGTNEKVLWAINRLQPDLLHILKPDGEYVETIPLDGKVPWFDEAATAKVLGAKRRSQNRTIERLRELHAPDSEAAADAATANDAEMKRALTGSIVHTFPVSQSRDTRDRAPARSATTSPGQRSNTSEQEYSETVELPSRVAGRSRSAARGDFPKADRIHEIQRHLDGQRKNHEDRVHVRKQAADFGSAINRSRIPAPTPQTEPATLTEIEEW